VVNGQVGIKVTDKHVIGHAMSAATSTFPTEHSVPVPVTPTGPNPMAVSRHRDLG
jgi:hypothetical protein